VGRRAGDEGVRFYVILVISFPALNQRCLFGTERPFSKLNILLVFGIRRNNKKKAGSIYDSPQISYSTQN
jgi:hypothetical protein